MSTEHLTSPSYSPYTNSTRIRGNYWS